MSDPSTPQDFNRYSYVNNRPIIMNDPSGHTSRVTRPIADSPKNPASCAKKPWPNAKVNMDKIPVSADDSTSTYISASIGVQNPYMNRINIYRRDGTLFRNGIYTGEGPAKITDAEMDTGYGDPINDGNNGYGLGLRTPENQLDQNDPRVAFIAMGTRIQVRIDMCQNTKFPCTPTDFFLATALGGDAAISPGVVRDLGNGEVYGAPDSSTGIYQWKNFLDESTHKSHNLSVIRQFVNNVSYLQSKGAAVPDVDWKYICSLLK